MSAHPDPNTDRSRTSTLASSNPGRPPAHRQASYSSLNEALGSNRRAHPAFPTSHPITTTSTTSPAMPASAQISSDGRYMYQQPPQGMASYDYQSYPGAFHDPQAQSSSQQQIPQPHHFVPRPTRTPSAQSHSPSHSAAFNPGGPSSSPYSQTQPYPSPSYPTPSSTTPAAQWSTGAEVWSQYGQPYITPPPGQEAPVQRPPETQVQAGASTANAQRAFNAPSAGPSHDPHNYSHNQPQTHRDSGPPSKTSDSPAQAKGPHPRSQPQPSLQQQSQQPQPQQPSQQRPQPSRKRSGKEPASRQTTPPAVVDYAKLADSYRHILETTNAGRLPSEDVLDRVLQVATHNLHILRPASGSSQPAVPAPAPAEVGASGGAGGEEGEGGTGPRRQQQQQQQQQQQVQQQPQARVFRDVSWFLKLIAFFCPPPPSSIVRYLLDRLRGITGGRRPRTRGTNMLGLQCDINP
ncbi:hypothetical protein OF83DRAFT_1080840 [Amylostereum chailletii]|nr:hypothetical protein OF83DRAFT_1080840 [Amylostereum chailletii]